MVDPYERKEAAERKWRRAQSMKIKNGVFRNMHHGNEPLNKIKKVFGEEGMKFKEKK